MEGNPRNESGVVDAPASSLNRVPLGVWITASRPRTLPAAIAPILVGTALAASEGVFHPFVLIAAMVSAIFIQIGTNLSNDYSDSRRGADTEDRLGPVRVTAGGLVAPRQVLAATWLAFAIAFAAGIYLIVVAGWVLLVVGVVSILAGILYTGGPKPYGYEGLGEVFVFLFFGVVAVSGSYYIQTLSLSGEALALSVPVGMLGAAVLMVNNIRDIDTDRRADKNTLAVKIGRHAARHLYAATIYGAFLCLVVVAVVAAKPWLLIGLAALPFAPKLVRTVQNRSDGSSLNKALARTAGLSALFALLVVTGLLLA